MALLFVACQNEPGVSNPEDGLVTARFGVTASELSTRADDTTTATGYSSALGAIDNFTDADWANYNLRFTFEVYAADGNGDPIAKERQVKVVDSYKDGDVVNFEVRLVPMKEYKFVVFADFVDKDATSENVSDLYYNTTNLREITMIDGKMEPMDEARDAYFVSKNLVIKTDIEEPLKLTRPFGKIRVVTQDIEHIQKYVTPAKATVTYKNYPIYKSFDAVNGAISTERTDLVKEYDLRNTPYKAGRDANASEMTLFADYLLADPDDQLVINFLLNVEDANNAPVKSNDFIGQIPIQRNHLTTIEGNLLTTQTNIKVTIDDTLTELTPIVWEDAVEEDVESWENGQVDTDGNYEFVVNGKTDSFLVTVNNEAVVNGKLTPGTYTLADNAAIDDKLTFTVEHISTRAAEVNILNGQMIVEANEAEYTIDLNLHYEKVDGENKEEYKVSYNYTGEITIAEPLATPVVEAAVEGNVVTLTWAAVEGAAQYGITVGTEMPVFVEETTYVFTGEYETEYTFNVVAISEDNASEPATVTVTTEAAPAAEAYKLYFNNLANWTKVYAHIWANEGEDLGLESVEWPGRELTETEELDGVTYYVFQLPAVATGKTLNVVFNDGAGTQTKDLSGVVEGNLFFDNYVEPVAPSETILYLQPNKNWNIDGARFAAYFFGNGETWVDMTLVEGETNIYAVTVPTGFENIIFCRMNPGAAANNWNNKWNQTADLKVPTDGTNLYTVNENTWDNGGGVWSVYTPAVAAPTALATPVVEAAVEGNVVTLTWAAIENAAQYGITVGTEMPVFVEGTTYVFTGEYETEYTFNVVAVPADEETYAVSEAAVVTATTEAAPVVEPTYTTVAEFLAAAEDDTVYTLKGTITRVANTSYGNFDLTDETGTVYIYGLCSPEGAQKYWAESGAKLGDDIVIKTTRTSFNGDPQGKNAIFVELLPGTLAFYTVSTNAVDFTSAGGEQVVNVAAYNTDAAVTATSDNSTFAVNVDGYNVTISAAANELEEEVTGNITIKVGDLAETVVKASLAAKPAAGVVEGGSSDFNTISDTNTSYVSGKTTAGWAYTNCAIFKGGTSDSSPAFKMIGDASNRALCMNGKTSAKGTITSPAITTGCGTLKFNYGLPFSDTKIKFTVDIIQNGEIVKTFTVDNSSATKLTKYSFEEAIDVAGEFQIVFKNLSPSNSTSNKDRTAIWDVEWTGMN